MSRSIRRRVSATIAAIATIIALTAPTAAVALDDPPPGDVTAAVTLSKTASVEEVAPGETFTYTLTLGCSAITDTGCRDAVLSDTVPAPFEVVTAVVGGGANSSAPPTVAGNSVTVDWTTPLGDGTVGLLDNTTGIVVITARLPVGTSYDLTGIPVVNTALLEGTNFVDVQDSVPVTPVIPLTAATTATKSLSPTTAVATAGTPIAATLGGSNDSNATVDTLVIQDPVDPDAAPNPFGLLGFVGFGAVTAPAGTVDTAYEVYVGGAWVAATGGSLPGGVDAADVRGTRVTFTGAIPTGATATVGLDLQLTELATTQPDGFAVTNTVQSAVALGDARATDDAASTFVLSQNDVQVTATKSFTPDLVLAGETSTVALGARNTSTIPIDSLTITEPSTGSFPAAYTFDGFTAGVTYPAGAGAGRVVYTFTDGETEEVAFANAATPANPAARDLPAVASFQIVFTGSAIVPGASTSVSFQVATDPDLAPLPLEVANEVGVTGTSQGAVGTAAATDEVFVYDEVLETFVGKSIRPSQILASPGEPVTVSLTGGLTERPDPPTTPTGTTGYAQQLVIQDPPDPAGSDAWWNAFDLTAITQTPVPADSALRVEYYDTTDATWKVLSGPIAGPTIYSAPVPGAITGVAGGVRFVYDYTGTGPGFAPGTDLAPNVTSALRADGRYTPGPVFSDDVDTLVPNCAQSDARSATAGVAPASAVTADPCPTVTLTPADPGTADLIDKTFGTSSSGGVKSVIARSGDTIPSVLSWSTGGFSNLERVEITDTADPAVTPLAQSVFNAFDLTRVQPITPATDPLIAFDQVQQVLLYNGTAWVDAANDPCPAACIGQFPGMNLTTAERASTIGVRLVFGESPARASASEGNLDAPAVGSGVARSFGNTRPITLTWQVRDERRSDSTAVLGDELYNLTDPGVVRNTVNASGYPADGATPLSANDQDDVVIVDVPITTTTDKTWTGGPLAVPDTVQLPSAFPLSRLSVTTRNTTPARVDDMVITDPAPGSIIDRRSDPFQAFRLNTFVSITQPAGATSTTVTLFCPDATTPTYTRTEALALVPGTLPCDAIGFQIAFSGRISAGASGAVSVDLRLRDYWRDTTERVSVADSPIANTAQGVVADVDEPASCPPADGARFACDQGSATIALAAPSFSVDATKTISPAGQKEDDFSPVTVTIAGQPGGSARPESLTLEDDDASFWNALDFTGVAPSWTLPAPIGLVDACYLDGGTFTAGSVATDTVGGTWSCSGLVELAAAKTFLAAAPDTVHGVRFTFTQTNGLGWSNPSNPIVAVPLLVERRADLRSGGRVPTDRSDQLAAPGEATAGVFVNTLDVRAESVDVGVGQNLSATDTADAAYTNVHLQVAVSVAKSPSGDVQPGSIIPFTLTYTNTGESPLYEPVFSDELPTDAQGAQLIFSPDRDPSVSPYTFALAGAAPAPGNGTPLPTDPAAIEIEETPDTIFFRMPAGSVLEPGQTYTITIPLVIRPGISAGTALSNRAAVGIDDPFDTCTPAFDPVTGLCRDDAIVTPLAIPAVRTIKYVKSDAPVNEPGVPEVFSTTAGYSCDSSATADGFYRAPCIPVTRPGGTETWRFTVSNAGTLPLDKVVSIDNLPTPGDQGLIVTQPRGSSWQPTFVGGVQLVPGATSPAGATLTQFYSTATRPCIADLNPLGTQCAAGSWLPLDGSVDPATVRSLKFVIDFPTDNLQPGETIDLQFQTRTTPQAPAATDYPVAYNTVSTGGTAIGVRRVTVPATEGRRVGVAYPTGSVQLQKLVTGDGAAFAPDSFDVQLTCEIDGSPMDALPVVTLAPGDPPVQVDGLPLGAECSATEEDYGQSSAVIGTATVNGPDDEISVITVTNVYELGGFTVSKQIDSTAVDEDGDPIGYATTFDFAASCDFRGAEVIPDADRTFTLADDDEKVFTDLPVGADCTVTETDTGGAASTTVNGVPQTGAPEISIEVEPDATANTAAFVNVFTVGSVQVTKNVTGAGVDAWGNGPFTVQLVCTFDEATTAQVYSATRDVTRTDNTWIVENLPTGAECTVSELEDGGATESALEPADGVVTIGVDGDEGGLQVVTVTNVFRVGGLDVFKEVTGPGAPQFSDGPFVFSVSCTLDGSTVFTGDLTVTGDGSGAPITSEPLTGLPVGAECTVTETGNGGADEAPAPVTVTIPDETDEGPSVVTAAFLNAFSAGGVTLTKTLEGPGATADYATSAVFSVRVTCQVAGPDDTLLTLLSAEYLITGGETIEVTDADGVPVRLPRGAHCFGEETVSGGATTSTVNADSYDNALVVTSDDELQTLALAVTNTFEVGSLQLSKVVDGTDAAAHASQEFLFELSCAFDQGESEPTILMDREVVGVEGGQTLTVPELPIGAFCWVAEPDSGGADRVQITHSTSALPAVVGSDDAAIVVTNTFTTPTAPLPATGVDGRTVAIVGGIAGILVLGGALVLFLSRRRRNE